MYFFNFIYSLSDTKYWDKLVNHKQTNILVVNINSGPYSTPSAAIDNTQISTTFVNYIAAIKAKNPLLKVLGYVNSGGTNYTQVDGVTHIFKARWKTTNPWQNGTELQINWNSGQKWDMLPQVQYWYANYGVDGIMFDNAFGGNIQNGGVNDATQNAARDTFYQTIYTGMRGLDATKTIYLNCGGQWPTTWVDGTLGSGNPIFDKITVAEVNFVGNRAGYPRGDQYVSGNSGPFNTPQPNTAFPDSTFNSVLSPQVVARAQDGTFKYSRNLFVGLLTTGYVNNDGPSTTGNNTYTLAKPSRADMANFMDTCYNNNIGNVYVSDTPAYNSYTAFPTIWDDDVVQGWGESSYVKFYADATIQIPTALSTKITPSVIADPTSPTHQLKINADGSINVDVLSGGGGGGGGATTLGAGTALAGGFNLVDSAGSNKAAVDSSGNQSVKVTNSLALADGQLASIIHEIVLSALTAGGPPLANATPSLNAVDRLRTYQGKNQNSYTITASVVGDTQLNCASGALKTIYPGALVRLSGGAANEYVMVSPTYVPSTTATAIPLISPVVNASQNTATFDTFAQAGPQANALLPTGMLMVTTSIIDPNAGNLYIPRSATLDAQNGSGYQGVVHTLYNGSTFDRAQGKLGVTDTSPGGRSTVVIAAGLATNTIVKASAGRIARILITAAGTNSLIAYDNASAGSGTIIAATPATTTVGQVFDFGLPASNGIYVAGNSGNPGVTISYY